MKDKDKRIETLHRLCFNNPNYIIELEGISPLADDRTQVNRMKYFLSSSSTSILDAHCCQ